mgnify:FL=1
MSHSYLHERRHEFRQEKFYRVTHEDRERRKLLVEFKRYSVKCSRLLFNLVVALNEFADTVRATIDLDFCRREGKFAIQDSMGVMKPYLEGKIFMPDRYFPNDGLDELPAEE